MILFFSILAWVFLVLSVVRIGATILWAHAHPDLMNLCARLGDNPMGRALTTPFLVLVVSACWLISRLFT